jgi:hypothetical protein
MPADTRSLEEDAPEKARTVAHPCHRGRGECLPLAFTTFADCGGDFLSAPTQIEILNIQRRPGTLGGPKHEFLAISATNQDRSLRPSLVEDCCETPPGLGIGVDLHFS